jgi:hypothetical protein
MRVELLSVALQEDRKPNVFENRVGDENILTQDEVIGGWKKTA